MLIKWHVQVQTACLNTLISQIRAQNVSALIIKSSIFAFFRKYVISQCEKFIINLTTFIKIIGLYKVSPPNLYKT